MLLLLFPLTLFLMIPKAVKSVAKTTRVVDHARNAMITATNDPTNPAKQAIKKEMKVKMQATGCRIITFVNPLAVFEPTSENPVLTAEATIWLTLYPIERPEHESPPTPTALTVQYPKVPNVSADLFARSTRRIEMLLMMGEEIVVIIRRMAAAKRRKHPNR